MTSESRKKLTTAELINELKARGISEDEIALLLMKMPKDSETQAEEKAMVAAKVEEDLLKSEYAPKVTDFLREIGVPAHIRGYKYLRFAIVYILDNKDLDISVTKELYPMTAKYFKTTSSRVERAIRHAIEVAWERGKEEIHASYFGNTVDFKRGKPTNSEFVFMAAECLSSK